MSDERDDHQLDAFGTIGGKATIEARRARVYAEVTTWFDFIGRPDTAADRVAERVRLLRRTTIHH